MVSRFPWNRKFLTLGGMLSEGPDKGKGSSGGNGTDEPEGAIIQMTGNIWKLGGLLSMSGTRF